MGPKGKSDSSGSTTASSKTRSRSEASVSVSGGTSDSKSRDHNTLCSICKKHFPDQLDKGECISCDSCQRWYHSCCVGLSINETKIITNLDTRGVRFFCPPCTSAVAPKPSVVNVENKLEQLTDKMSELEVKLNEIQQSTHSTSRAHKDYAAALSQSVEAIKTHEENLTRENRKLTSDLKVNIDTLKETSHNANKILENQSNFLDLEKRKSCAILHRLTESGQKQLKEKISGLCNEISLNPDQLVQFFRLGRPRAGGSSNKDRPVKVVLPDEAKKWDFVKRINALKPDGVFATLDMPQEDRDKEYHARQKIRELRPNNPGVHFRAKNGKVFKVEGEKWTPVD
jgi:hypothetical protein